VQAGNHCVPKIVRAAFLLPGGHEIACPFGGRSIKTGDAMSHLFQEFFKSLHQSVAAAAS
jgi:hypothetical protein